VQAALEATVLAEDVDQVETFVAAVNGELVDGPDAAGVLRVVVEGRS
jgi:hypothetical protein